MTDTTYQPDGNMHCHFYFDDPDACWGQVELVAADYSGDGETVYMCQGHKSVYNGGDYDGEYVPPPDYKLAQPSYCRSCQWHGTRSELIWSRPRGYICPQCHETTVTINTGNKRPQALAGA